MAHDAEQTEKTFTQSDVESIVAKRLARDKASATATAELDKREKEIKKREEALNATAFDSYLKEKGITIDPKNVEELRALTNGNVETLEKMFTLTGGLNPASDQKKQETNIFNNKNIKVDDGDKIPEKLSEDEMKKDPIIQAMMKAE